LMHLFHHGGHARRRTMRCGSVISLPQCAAMALTMTGIGCQNPAT
jgi:hypothetical protein